jgi:hypothetical protein
MYTFSANELNFAVGGSDRLALKSAQNDFYVANLGINGTAINPTWSFILSPGTGLFSPAVNNLGISTAGTERMRIDASGNVGVGTAPAGWARMWVDGSIGIVSGTGDYFIGGNPVVSDNGTAVDIAEDPGWTALHLSPGGTRRVTVLDSGNVGVGTTTPGSLLQVGNPGTLLGTLRLAGNTSGFVQLQTAAAAGSWNMTLPATAGTNGQALVTNGSGVTSWATVPTSGGTFLAGAGTGDDPSISFIGDPDAGFFSSGPGIIGVTVDGIKTADLSGSSWDVYRKIRTANCGATDPCFSFTTDMNSGIYSISDNIVGFSTNGAERMRLSAGGQLSIGNTSTTHALNVTGSAGLSTGTAWTNTSDARLKDVHGDYEYGLNEILKLNTVRFNYKKNNALDLNSDVPMTGFVAQEVQKVIPDAVTTRADGYLELNVDPIHWATVNAVQDLYGMCKATDQQTKANTEDIAQIKRELASLKDENQNLKSENEKMKKDLEMIKKKLGL